MRRSYSLKGYNGLGRSLEFAWDPATGEVSGRDAAAVREMAEAAKHAGYCLGAPHPFPHKVMDPLRTLSEMAVILGNVWKLPPDLAAAYPKPPESETKIPPGAIA